MKIAVVGSGISGLSAAYYLSKKHHVDLYEREDHFGGHSHTLDLILNGKKVSVDIGFIVFNFQTFTTPNIHILNYLFLINNSNMFNTNSFDVFDYAHFYVFFLYW